ncbi:MAG: Imm52 family immunity protein [Byssovorax sp.]
MSRTVFKIGFYWGVRPASLPSSAREAQAFLSQLRGVLPGLGSWSVLTVAGGAPAACSSEAQVAARLAAGEQKYKLGAHEGTFYKERFFSPQEPRTGCTMTLGLTLDSDAVWFRNSVELEIPDSRALRAAAPAAFVETFRIGAASFHPRWGILATEQQGVTFPSIASPSLGEAAVGWMSYLSAELGAVPPLPPPAQVIPLGKMGSVVLARPFPWDTDVEAHRDSVTTVRAALKAAGLLEPLLK